MRLDKFIVHTVGCSRTSAHQLIKNKKIIVNGRPITKKDFNVTDNDEVYFNEKKLIYNKYIYLMLNKPSGVVSATIDNVHKTVIDLVKDDFPNYQLFPVGRLDIDTEGLLFITNDGTFAHKITSPKTKTYKKYYLEVEDEFTIEDQEKVKQGFTLVDDQNKPYQTKEAILEILSKNSAYISICEGKFHQVKNMCFALGKPCTYLKRVAIKDIYLDESLPLGKYRHLTPLEVKMCTE